MCGGGIFSFECFVSLLRFVLQTHHLLLCYLFSYCSFPSSRLLIYHSFSFGFPNLSLPFGVFVVLRPGAAAAESRRVDATPRARDLHPPCERRQGAAGVRARVRIAPHHRPGREVSRRWSGRRRRQQLQVSRHCASLDSLALCEM